MNARPPAVCLGNVGPPRDATRRDRRSGIRDQGLFQSAVARPNNLLAYSEPSSTSRNWQRLMPMVLPAATRFLDGNKRTAFVSVVFLELNGYELRACEADSYVAFMELAKSSLSLAELEVWFTDNSASGVQR
jgi:death-on-curing protein